MSSEALNGSDLPYEWLISEFASHPNELARNAVASLWKDYRFALNEWRESDRMRLELKTENSTQAARIASLEAERDQLRAEVERLRKPLTPEAVWQLWAEMCKPERPTVDLVEAFARAIEAAKEAK